jgi:hypothetical protein
MVGGSKKICLFGCRKNPEKKDTCEFEALSLGAGKLLSFP